MTGNVPEPDGTRVPSAPLWRRVGVALLIDRLVLG
jgi:hypothetical protein